MQKTIKLITSLIFLFILVIFYLSLNRDTNYDTENLVGNKLVEIKLKSFQGNEYFTNEILKNNDYTLINFWASWCAPCIKEMKSLNSLQKKMSSIRVITISQDKSLDLAKNFFKKNKHKALEKYFDKDKKILSKFSLRGLPTTFIVNKDYKVFAKVEGIIEWDSKSFMSWLNEN